MASEESLERSDLRSLQRERERERRRMRDRQRRQCMSVQERENHLARRRRNYQLRRQRVGNAQSDSQPEQTSIASIGVKITAIENQAIVPALDLSVQRERDTAAKQGNGQIIVQGPRSEGKEEATAYKLDEFPKRLRLNHIRHLARTLNNPVGGINGRNDRNGSDVIMMENESTHYQPPKRLRLTNVKRLARAKKSCTKQTSGHNRQSGMEEERSLTQSKIQLICNDMVDYAQPVNINEEDEQMSADG